MLTPLTNLTGKGTKFVWGEAQDKAFKEMKRQMAKSAMLAFPNFDLPFDLYTDASDYQIGACLIQKNEATNGQIGHVGISKFRLTVRFIH